MKDGLMPRRAQTDRGQVVGAVLGGADDERLTLVCPEVAQDLVVDGEHLACLGQQCLPVGGEPDPAVVTLHERAADGGLQPAHVLAHRALGEVEGTRGALEPPAVNDSDETPERYNIKGSRSYYLPG
jgi:hypothetical protein